MGRLLGAHDSDELDRSDLNKCPDCGCFFPQDNCPLCGKECPDAFRAGNRKAVKKKKARRKSSGRVTFVEWYHSWWFIILMLFVFPIAGIVLLLTSPHKTAHKAIFIACAIVVYLFATFGIGMISDWLHSMEEPVSASLTKAECETVTPEDFYRSAAGYNGKYVSLTLTVESKYTEYDGYYGGEKYNTYYSCRPVDGGDFTILVRDCVKEDPKQFIPGDTITVYGEGQGQLTVYDLDYCPHTAPTVFAAYIELK